MKIVFLVFLGLLGFGSLAACAIGPGVAYAQLAPPMLGYMLFLAGAALGTLVFLVGAIASFKLGVFPTLLIGAMGLPGAILIGQMVMTGREFPMIHDISTDTTFPPRFEHAQTIPEAERVTDWDFPKANAEIIATSYPDVQSIPATRNIDEVFGQLLDFANKEPDWEITATRISDKESIFEGVALSKVFRFEDDFIVRVTRVGDQGCVIDMRSRSRDGLGDMGVNANRIRSFLKKIGAQSLTENAEGKNLLPPQ